MDHTKHQSTTANKQKHKDAELKSPSPQERSQDTDPISESDPLELHQLSLSYDYLMYKIKDYIKTLTDQTYTSILQKQRYINEDYFEKQLKLSTQYEKIDELMKKCNELELEFSKIDQLVLFVEEFNHRLDAIESRFKELG
ncbi:uncharacterized protein KGF55_004118 [Candida pseudojiufengensis]|uniref:uncharacterized protein n=1 Tax=Candida pseudojiufengensis TaxID=497109 RepID=UPI002224A637|nr:uncharacterized protein KGF55_004118 [Candida pseudojiufengensis]KAI5961193.1 hypothetical protein KGF55_004118 [Candida pseudojiufengensis]